MSQLQHHIGERLFESEPYHLIDSMPVEVCKLSRASRYNKKQKQKNTELPAGYGYCAAQKRYYFGYKLYAVCIVQGVFKTLTLSATSTHDIHYLGEVKERFSHCTVIGDKGYLNQAMQHDLFEQKHIQMITPKRKNQTNAIPFPQVYRKTQKRIETLFSQLCDQFMIQRNYSKPFEGLAIRVLSKITALTIT